MVQQYLGVHSGNGEPAASSAVVPTEKQKLIQLYQCHKMQVGWGWVVHR
jgi:hypothetical protein